LANDIEVLEDRCNALEARNAWLTKKLMNSQRRIMERTLSGNSTVVLRRTFKAWLEAMNELNLEAQLDAQTMSLDQCQRVAKELGQALAQEQQIRQGYEESHRGVHAELDAALAKQRKLKEVYEKQELEIKAMEKRVAEAESCLMRSRLDAEAVIESAKLYEKRRKDLEFEVRDTADQQQARGGIGYLDPMEACKRLREESKVTVQKANKLLENRAGSPSRVASPERE